MKETIFVSIASYLDPMLFFTLHDAFAKALYPERLAFAVVDQSAQDQREAIAALPFANQVRYVHVHPQDTLGVCWARATAFSLYDGEDFVLQIDSHMLFEEDWDVKLLAQHASLRPRSAKPIVSTYPYRFDIVDGMPKPMKNEGRTALVLRPHPEKALSAEDAVLRFMARHLFTDEPVLGCHVSAGFLFAAGAFVEEVPYDPYLYFHGEEQSLAVRAFTRGWDIFHPMLIPVYHLYKSEGTAYQTHHWHGETEARRAFRSSYLLDRARLRLNRLLMGDGLPGAYGLGSARTMAQFAELSGIDYAKHTISDPFGGKLC
ncbi:MAG: GlcNAc-transferase family protein [Telluria sp.]